jgi:toxin FitB
VSATAEHLLYLSVLTLGEIRRGISFLPSTTRRAALEAWLDSDLVLRCEGRILSIDRAIADRWGRIAGSAATRKHPIAVIGRNHIASQSHSGHTEYG